MNALIAALVHPRSAAVILALCVALSVLTWESALAQPADPAAKGAAGTPESAGSSGVPRLELSPTALEFGEVWQGERAAGEFTVRNVGTAPLTLTLKSSCGCTVASK
ncbi:MAG: DUF1573 domain-containing protein, partial [Phycisphaerae bacterium]|nr:DUF1573 domain-containing protein [Phycisphaerae bacterium]